MNYKTQRVIALAVVVAVVLVGCYFVGQRKTDCHFSKQTVTVSVPLNYPGTPGPEQLIRTNSNFDSSCEMGKMVDKFVAINGTATIEKGGTYKVPLIQK